MFDILKREWRTVLFQSVLTAVFFVSLVFAVAYGLGGPQRDVETNRLVRETRSDIVHILRHNQAISDFERDKLLGAICSVVKETQIQNVPECEERNRP